MEQKNFKLESSKDLFQFVRQNALPLVGFLILGAVSSVGQAIQAKRSERSRVRELQDQVIASQDQYINAQDTLLSTLRETRRAQEAALKLSHELEGQDAKFTPCTKEVDLELLSTRMWLSQQTEILQEDAVLACSTYEDCPLTTEASKEQFQKDLNHNIYTAQFFCPPEDHFSYEGETQNLAFVLSGQDPRRVPQVFLRPEILSWAESDSCELITSVVHELIHVTSSFSHDETSENHQVDWAYYMGNRAGRMCRGELQ